MFRTRTAVIRAATNSLASRGGSRAPQLASAVERGFPKTFHANSSVRSFSILNIFSNFNSSMSTSCDESKSPIRIGPSEDSTTNAFSTPAPVPTPDDGITVSIDNAIAAADPAAVAEVLGNSPTHLVMKVIDFVHIWGDVPYWGAIIACTIALRTILIPITVSGMQNSARLAAMKPEMERIQKAFTADPLHGDVRAKKKYEEEMKGLFKKYNCNPIRSLTMPLLQIPIFMSFFFALREMGQFFPDFATGGALWFTDLTIPDHSYALPIINALSFLGMLELTTMSNNQMPNKALMKNVMRGIAVVMIPMTLDMPQAVFMYWSANSSFSVVQMLTLKNKALKKWLDIPDPPPEDPSIIDKPRSNPLQGLMEAAKKAAEERKAQQAGTPSFIPTPLVSAKAKESPEAAKKEAEKPKAIEAPAELPKGPTFAVHPRFKKKSS